MTLVACRAVTSTDESNRGLTPRPAAGTERIAEFSAVIVLVQAWAQRTPDIKAVGLAGSWARGAQRPDSDADIVVLTDTTDRYALSVDWIHDVLLRAAPVTRTQWWGPVIERRLVLPSDFELEFGFATSAWAETEPVDGGTARVVSDGFRVLYDPHGILARLVDAVRDS